MAELEKQIQNTILFVIGGISYFFIEIIWRGYSHITMIILGGLCFLLIGLMSERYFSFERNIIKQSLISSLIITTLELIAGLILNIGLRLNIWDYSSHRFNLLGQISLEQSIIWLLLSLPIIVLYDYLRHWLFGKEMPVYRLV